MGKNFTYVDNSNVFIEGQRVSAVERGLARDINDAMHRGITDPHWRIDYGALHKFVCGGPSEIGAARLCGSVPPGDSFWKMVERYGFDVQTYDRSVSNKEKKVDVTIALWMIKDAYSGTIERGVDEITLVAGDNDYLPVVEDLVESGHIVDVVFWSHAGRELREAARKFVVLNQYLSFLTTPWAPRP